MAPAGGSGPDAADPTTPRSALRLVVDPVFGPFFAGRLLSNLGVWIHQVAAAVAVYALTRSATWVGAVAVGQFLPQVLIAPWSGARADRADRRSQLIAGRLIGAVGSASCAIAPVAAGTGGAEARSAAALVIVGSTLLGFGFAIGGPALHALVPSLVAPRDLPAAVTLNTFPITMARALGPAVGAVIVASAGVRPAFLAAAAGNLAFAVLLLATSAGHAAPPAAATSGRGSIRAGLAHVVGSRELRGLLLTVGAIGFAVDPVVTLGPSLADALGGGAELVGAIASAFGTGAAVGLVVVGRLRGRLDGVSSAAAGLALLGVGYLFAAPMSDPVAAVAAIGLAGCGMTVGLTSLTTRVHQQVDEEFRGRVMAAWSIAFLGTRPLAAVLLGGLTDLTGVRAALAAVGAALVVAAVLLRRRLAPGAGALSGA